MANVISKPEAGFDELVDLCSGRFVSQINSEGMDSQEEDEFAGFDFGEDDDDNEQGVNGKKENLSTPKVFEQLAECRTAAVDGITPKLSEKIPKTRLLMQFDEEAGKQKESKIGLDDSQDEDEEEEIVGVRVRVRKQKRLQFSGKFF